MNYGKIIDGILHVYAAPGEGRKPIRDIVPDGYDRSECVPLFGVYTETEDVIGIEYVYVAPGQSLTEQRIADLESAQATTEQAVQDIILATLGGEA